MTSNLSIAVDAIKNSVSALDVGHAFGWDIDRHGRCPCPFHNGKDRNMKLFDGNRGYSCFVCHASGDVISLVRNYYHDMQFKQVISWFNDTFHLGLNIDSPLSKEAVKQAEIAQRKRKEEREYREWLHRTQFDLFLIADKIVSMLEEQRDRYVPKTPDETWHPLFCQAIELLPWARQFAQDCYFDCIEVKT